MNKQLYKEKNKVFLTKGLVHLDCPSCNTPSKSENIHLVKGIAKCHHCNAIFDYETYLPPFRNKPTIQLPQGIEILRLNSELEIKYKWRQNNSSFFTFFTLFWNGLLFPFVIGIILSGNWEMLFFLALHLTIGLVFLYFTLAHLLNTTFITVDRDKLSIEHGPIRLPTTPILDMYIKDISQVYVEKYTNGTTNGRLNIVYRVKIVDKQKREIVLAKGFKHPESAQYIEQEIELFLDIDDRANPKEVHLP